tara:strand:- start:233 stop:811 length:579 start_codon:yes stop_codon:yes gene_type:complete
MGRQTADIIRSLERHRVEAVYGPLGRLDLDEEGDKPSLTEGLGGSRVKKKGDTADKTVIAKSNPTNERLQKIRLMEEEALPDDVALKDYTCQAGDTLSSIAEKTGTTPNQLAAINNLTDKDQIAAGKSIKVRADVKVADIANLPDILDSLQSLIAVGSGANVGQTIRDVSPFTDAVMRQTKELLMGKPKDRT